MQWNTLSDAWAALLELPTWQGVLVVAGCSLLLAKVIEVGGDAAIRRVTRRIPGDVDKVVFRTLHPPLYITVAAVGMVAGFTLYDVFPAWTTRLENGLLTLLTLLWMYSLTRMGRRASETATEDERFDNQVVPIFQNVWTVLILGGGIFLVLSYWNVDVTPLLASAGIIGIVVGFAARDTIANFFGSIALYADRTYTVGDFLVLESGERGRVEDISIRSTEIRTRDDTVVTVPNSQLNTATLVNESAPEREQRVRVSVGVGYDSDLDHVEEVLLDVANDVDMVVAEPPPRVRVRQFGGSSIELDLLCWIPGPTLRGRVRHHLLKRIHATFRAEGIEIPFPQRVVSMPDSDAGRASDTPRHGDGSRRGEGRRGGDAPRRDDGSSTPREDPEPTPGQSGGDGDTPVDDRWADTSES